MIRNFIDIKGIASENALPEKNMGQLVQYSETETIFIPDDKPEAKNIFQIIISVDLVNTHYIQTFIGNTVVLDGLKEIKIIYTDIHQENQTYFFTTQIPYNTFFDLPKNVKYIEKANVFIIDAYFSLLDPRKIYSHIIYLLDIHYDEKERLKHTTISNSIQSGLMLSDRTTLDQQNHTGVLEKQDKPHHTISKDNAVPPPQKVEQPKLKFVDLDAEHL